MTVFFAWSFGLLTGGAIGTWVGMTTARRRAVKRSESVVLMKMADRALTRAVRASGRGKPGAAEDYMRLYDQIVRKAEEMEHPLVEVRDERDR